jgi:hypothetical protein
MPVIGDVLLVFIMIERQHKDNKDIDLKQLTTLTLTLTSQTIAC